MAHHQHIVRIDHEDKTPIPPETTGRIIQHLNELNSHQKIDCVILQDYEKGLLHKGNISIIIQKIKEIGALIAVDPKDVNFWEYKEVDLFKPNKHELSKALGYKFSINEHDIVEAISVMQSRLHNKITALTLSENGIFLCKGMKRHWALSESIDVVDVCGAGDAVIAMLSTMIFLTEELSVIGALANAAGATVCEQSGVSTINSESIKRKLTDS